MARLAQMDLGSVVVEVEQIAPETVMLKRVVSRKLEYRRPSGVRRVNLAQPIVPRYIPYMGLGNDPGEILEVSGIA